MAQGASFSSPFPLFTSHDKARVLSEALPFMQRYTDKTVVIKCGGHAMGEHSLIQDFARDIVLLKQSGIRPVIVHGGGPQISAMLAKLNIKSKFQDGLRLTDKETIEIVEMVLVGNVNKQIVSAINAIGGRAIGLSGKDANMLTARKITHKVENSGSHVEKIIDLGFVGEPEHVDCHILDVVSTSGLIPVLAPIATAPSTNETYNINADTFAGAIAGALRAERFLLLTDTYGVLDEEQNLIKELSPERARKLIRDGTISGGMIPKVETCLEAIDRGVCGSVILNGRAPHATLLEFYTEHGEGTIIR
ncbi:MAG: acetylglutamate kinase [Alphaproteobacteria bacterium]|nr:acetylglutamate kinase [Alphaproteobacteria bacterium]